MTVAFSLPHLMIQLRVLIFKDDYSRFVYLMKIVLPALAIILLFVVVLWARLSAQTDGFRLGYAAITQESVRNLSMLNARYFGIDSSNNPYSITADSGTQRSDDKDVVDMQSPQADFTTHSGAGVVVSGDHGVYHQHDQILDLSGHVNLYHEQGYEVHTDFAIINLKDGSASGDKPVDGHGPQGILNGTGFRIVNKGERIVVTGQSSLKLQGSGHDKRQSTHKTPAKEAPPKETPK